MGIRIRLLVLLAMLSPAAWTATTVQSVSVESATEKGARIRLQLSGPVSERVFTLDDPARLVLDLPATHLAKGTKLPPGSGPVHSIRAGSQAGQTLRLVVQLNGKLPHRVQEISTGRAESVLVVELGEAVAAAAPAVQVPAVPVPVRPKHAPEDSGRDLIVVIDPGHGGKDPGATGRNGTHEKDVVLGIARALKARVDQEPGMRAVLTRDDDRFIILRERMNLARAARADVFISIHADSIANRDVSGSSVYVLAERGASSEAARWLAERENAADLKGGVSLGDKSGQLASVLIDLSQDASMGASMEAAERVLARLDQVGTIRKTQVQQAAFVVLKSPDVPSMLVETAYISNPGEERKLRSGDYQAELADAIFLGVRDHFRRSPPDGTLFSRQQKARSAAPIIAGSTSP